MDVISKAVQYLNLGQTPVLACDQPLFAIKKQIQWISPNSYGEDLYVIMLGGLHIEMTALKALGKWLYSSGWTAALVQADITTPGKADSFFKGVACIQNKTYTPAGNFDEWRQLKEEENPQF